MHRGVLLGQRMVVACARSGSNFAALLRGHCGELGFDEKFELYPASPRNRERVLDAVIIPGGEAATLRCSRSSCVSSPDWNIVWRNPKIHAADREKIWLSCAEHRDFFEAYLGQRGFPVRSEALNGGGRS